MTCQFRLRGSPVFFDVDVAGIFAVAALEAFGLQHGGDDLDHFRIAAEEDIGVFGVERHAGVLVQRALFQDCLLYTSPSPRD